MIASNFLWQYVRMFPGHNKTLLHCWIKTFYTPDAIPLYENRCNRYRNKECNYLSSIPLCCSTELISAAVGGPWSFCPFSISDSSCSRVYNVQCTKINNYQLHCAMVPADGRHYMNWWTMISVFQLGFHTAKRSASGIQGFCWIATGQ